jgi:hypothetical protein
MRVRISFDALRLCLLVAAGVTSGYLWRAAFESSSPVEERIAEAPRIVEPAPAPPVVKIVPHHLTTTTRPAVAAPRVVRRAVVVTRHPAPVTLASTHVASSQGPAATPASVPPPKPSPSPKPSPPPASQPATTTTPSPPPVSAPVQQAAPPPTTTTTQTPGSTDDSRPGWGNGDKNHDHGGPGGKGK